MVKSKKEDISDIWDCEGSPLSYMIEPRGSVAWVSKDHVTKVEDLDNIMYWTS